MRCDVQGRVCEAVRRVGMVEKQSTILHVAARRYQCAELAADVLQALMAHPEAKFAHDELGRCPVTIASERLRPNLVPQSYWACWDLLDELPDEIDVWAKTA